jgi:hypothetical protein
MWKDVLISREVQITDEAARVLATRFLVFIPSQQNPGQQRRVLGRAQRPGPDRAKL